MWSKTELRWLAALTAAALLLRAIRLDSGLWLDEIYSLLYSFRLPLDQILTAFPRDNHHPLYAALAHLSALGFGESAWTLRLPSLLAGAATVPALYGLGRRLGGSREGFAAALLLALSWHHIWFSQNARGYVLLALAAVGSTWLLLRILDGESRPALAAGFAVVTALGAWTHLTMVFVAVGQAAGCLVLLLLPAERGRIRAAGRTLIGAFGLAALFTVALYAPMLGGVSAYFSGQPSGLRGVSTPAWAALEALRVLALGFGGGSLVLGIPLLLAGAAVFGLGTLSYARTNPRALALFSAPAAVIILGALAARGTMYPRFFFALLPFGLLLGVRGLAEAAGRLARALARPAQAGAWAAGLVAAAALLSLAALPGLYRHPKQDFAGALRFTESGRRPGDAVATAGAAALPYREWLGRDWPEVRTAAELAALRRRGAVWLIWTFPRYLAGSAPEIHAVTDRECPRAARFRGTVGGGDILVCRLEPSA
jgi:4-amino-4-deoxy-L-arabinose transferase-like glycosyltransferase